MLIFKVLCGSIRILSIKIVLWASPLPINNKDKTVDIKQDLGNQ
jgi:hypothetical protein